MSENQIIFTTEDGERVAFYVLEETTISGVNYLLVADSEDEEAEALILREKENNEEELVYDVVDDEEQLKAISKVFEELLDDIDINME